MSSFMQAPAAAEFRNNIDTSTMVDKTIFKAELNHGTPILVEYTGHPMRDNNLQSLSIATNYVVSLERQGREFKQGEAQPRDEATRMTAPAQRKQPITSG